MARDWQQTGTNVVNAGAGFVSGIAKAFGSIGRGIIRSAQGHDKLINGLCAVVGHVNTMNGQLKPEEISAFRNFILQQQTHPAFSGINADDLVQKMRNYAIAQFSGDTQSLNSAVGCVDKGGEAAQMIILGALACAYADGDCDANEQSCISYYAQFLGVDLQMLSRNMNLGIPQLGPPPVTPAIPAPIYQEPVTPMQAQPTAQPVAQPVQTQAVQQPVTPTPQPTQPVAQVCPMCKGQQPKMANCMFCKGTGQKQK